MPDPVFQGLSSVLTVGGNDASSGQITFPTVNAGELVLVIVQRNSYTSITSVTLGAQAMTEIKRIDSNSGTFQQGIWACKANSGGSNVIATASFFDSAPWLSMGGARWNNVNSATPLQSACNTAGCSGISGPATSQVLQQITTTIRALIVALGTDWDNYNTHTAQNGYTKRLDNAIAGGGSSTTLWAFDKVANAGNFGGAGETISTAASDRWLGAIFSFEPSGAVHASTGALSAGSALVAGTASSATTRPSSGALAAGSAGIAGSASHVPAVVSHETSGALAAGQAVVDGAAINLGPAQVARPVEDVVTAGWTDPVGGTTNLHQQIDEVVPDNDDYVRTGTLAVPYEFKYSALVDPLQNSNHRVSYILVGNDSASAVVRLMQGAVQISTWTESGVPAVPTRYDHILTGPQADSISNYGDLRLEVTANG